MKKITIIGFSLGLLIIATLIFMHYQKHPSDSMIRRKLPGTWIPNIADGRARTLTTSSDGHWTEQITGKIRTGRLEGTWQVRDGFLIITLTNNDLDMQVPSTHSSRIIRIDSHEYVLQSENGNTPAVVFKKVEP
jgi:hypothetical protein